jgi:hypothetical protein
MRDGSRPGWGFGCRIQSGQKALIDRQNGQRHTSHFQGRQESAHVHTFDRQATVPQNGDRSPHDDG